MEYLSPLGLEVFRLTVELGTFKAASAKLKISQPAVSAHIHRIENHLGVKLFENTYSRKLQPTEAGMQLYHYAVDLSTRNKEIFETLKQITNGQLGDICFAVCSSKFMMASLVAAYIKNNPNVNVIFLTTSSTKGKELLKHGDVDFALLMNPDDPQLASIPLYYEPMELICAPTHPLAEKIVISKKDLSNYGFVSCIKGSDYNRLLDNYLHQIGIYKIKKSAQVEDSIMILKMVEGGGGIGFLSRSTVEESLNQGKLVRLSLHEEMLIPKIEIHLFFRHKSNINRASQAFIKYILEEIPKKSPYITINDLQEFGTLFPFLSILSNI